MYFIDGVQINRFSKMYRLSKKIHNEGQATQEEHFQVFKAKIFVEKSVNLVQKSQHNHVDNN